MYGRRTDGGDDGDGSDDNYGDSDDDGGNDSMMMMVMVGRVMMLVRVIVMDIDTETGDRYSEENDVDYDTSSLLFWTTFVI